MSVEQRYTQTVTHSLDRQRCGSHVDTYSGTPTLSWGKHFDGKTVYYRSSKSEFNSPNVMKCDLV